MVFGETLLKHEIKEREIVLKDEEDILLPFFVEKLNARGRIVRLGAGMTSLFTAHEAPSAVHALLGQASVASVLLGSFLTPEGRFHLQTETNGPVHRLIIVFEAPRYLRALVRFNPEALEALSPENQMKTGNLLGEGHLALTCEPALQGQSYQGIIALNSQDLDDALKHYMGQSEQNPLHLHLSYRGLTPEDPVWRAGGIAMQTLPLQSSSSLSNQDVSDLWFESKVLLSTLQEEELVDPRLSREKLLYRLFHHHHLRVFPAQHLKYQCRCSREKIERLFRNLSVEERQSLRNEKGQVEATCSFCSKVYLFSDEEQV